jgi:hypothetical protein
MQHIPTDTRNRAPSSRVLQEKGGQCASKNHGRAVNSAMHREISPARPGLSFCSFSLTVQRRLHVSRSSAAVCTDGPGRDLLRAENHDSVFSAVVIAAGLITQAVSADCLQ